MVTENKYQVVNVPLNEIFADPLFNCRGFISASEIVDLAKDIKARGLDQPIVLQPYVNGQYKYRVVAGHRRHKAFLYNNAETIPAYIRTDLDELNARMLNFRENLHRQALNIKQEANALKFFLDYKRMTNNRLSMFSVKELAEIFGQSTGWVQARKELLTLPESIQDEAATGILNQDQVKQIAKIKRKEEQFELVKKIKEHKLRGEKVKLRKSITRSSDVLKARERDRMEIIQMNSILYDIIGPGLVTRYGAWASGEISTAALFSTVEEFCKENDIKYKMPEFIKNAVSGSTNDDNGSPILITSSKASA